MSWKIEGRYFENCPCNAPCPCTASLDIGADVERCTPILAFHVDSGEVEGVDVSGLSVVAVADTPQVMTEGNWRLGVFIDAAASDEQAEKLGAVFGGQLGGPMEALGPLIGENLGAERAAIEFQSEGTTHSLKVGDAIDMEIENIVPFGSETGKPARHGQHLPPRQHRGRPREGEALADERLRDGVREPARLLRLLDHLLLGRLRPWPKAVAAPRTATRSVPRHREHRVLAGEALELDLAGILEVDLVDAVGLAHRRRDEDLASRASPATRAA